ncbi:thiol:disulfide interchange protein [Glaciecola sp. KUL10]|nr:thiol:disulfide interchange protein [Glaciecola sp. KUL10]
MLDSNLSLRSWVLFLMAVIIAYPSVCKAQLTDSLFSNEPTFLKVDEAFVMDFEQRDDELVIKWDIAEGYYLYKKQFQAPTKNAELGEGIFPKGVIIEDEFFGESEVYFEDMEITYPIVSADQDSIVRLRFQGCAEAGLCYPPTTKVIYLDAVVSSSDTTESAEATSNTAVKSEQFQLADRLISQESLLITLGLFVLLGLGLAFTPCVFPMYPILSSIIMGAGKGKMDTSRALFLSVIYVQGMAITYSLLGLVVASAGVQFQAALQSEVVLIVFIVLFVLLAIAMFGGYEIQLPSKWQEKLNGVSNSQKQGNPVGVFIMGIISGLVASPCTTAPLTAILLVIAQTGDLVLGFSALYALSIGMGIPLIIFGITGGKLLPKAGQWMNVVKATFGFMMLSVAILFVERFIIADWTGLLWAALGLALFTYWFTINQDTKLSLFKGLRTAVVMIGMVGSVIYGYTVVSKMQGHTNQLVVATAQGSQSLSEKGHPKFAVVKDIDDFYAKLAQASSEGKSVMLDLYADWCIACKEFEKYTFPDPNVIKALENTVWMQIDLTDNTPQNLAFQEYFKVLGLPTILFFDKNGYELSQSRVTGFMKAEPFANHVENSLNQP